MAKEKRQKIILECKECGERNYSTNKNTLNQKERVELKKFCKRCRKHASHKEIK